MAQTIADLVAWVALALAVAWFIRGLQRVRRSQSMEREWIPAALIAWAANVWLVISSQI
ncbi:hypothetical protein SAMN04489867_2342 [Pedococcus dokdonensis]|uniref:Uncharacterized protein n=1 Tax=Pedococcus dokdonensis TaxID=443156 RepID=A0A1H0SFI4_9MICO|nr:hypothetical protein [Pedococcus dokdonensis]SDP40513.1 hypothetical protein SAMN04489867_2342 [Pedococcus dokdonensis]